MRLVWQEAPKAERLTICKNYLLVHPECSRSIEDLDEAWNDCWYDVIKFTFGPTA